jgi:hypothetical protein
MVIISSFSRTASLAVLLLTAPGLAARAQVTTSPTFDWTGPMPAGSILRLYTADGPITVTRSQGNQVVVHGEQQREHYSSRSSSGPIVYERLQDGDNVTICAYEQDEGSCSDHGLRDRSHHRSWDHSPSAELRVELPAGIRLVAGSGDGEVSVRGAGSDVDASTGDGDITIEETAGPVKASTGDGKIWVSAASGPVDASTGDGSIEVRMGVVSHPRDMHFSTGDGSVTVYVPAAFAGELDAHTGDGHIESDFPLELHGRLDEQHIHTMIGGGGSTRLSISTGDGDIRLRKGE